MPMRKMLEHGTMSDARRRRRQEAVTSNGKLARILPDLSFVFAPISFSMTPAFGFINGRSSFAPAELAWLAIVQAVPAAD